ncbi:MAG: hypothetical protein ACYC1Z_00820 [Georgenia sp.]
MDQQTRPVARYIGSHLVTRAFATDRTVVPMLVGWRQRALSRSGGLPAVVRDPAVRTTPAHAQHSVLDPQENADPHTLLPILEARTGRGTAAVR